MRKGVIFFLKDDPRFEVFYLKAVNVHIELVKVLVSIKRLILFISVS